jgi:hypothetical protein
LELCSFFRNLPNEIHKTFFKSINLLFSFSSGLSFFLFSPCFLFCAFLSSSSFHIVQVLLFVCLCLSYCVFSHCNWLFYLFVYFEYRKAFFFSFCISFISFDWLIRRVVQVQLNWKDNMRNALDEWKRTMTEKWGQKIWIKIDIIKEGKFNKGRIVNEMENKFWKLFLMSAMQNLAQTWLFTTKQVFWNEVPTTWAKIFRMIHHMFFVLKNVT